MNDATERLSHDLRDAGLAPQDVTRVCRLYSSALTNARRADWERLYRATFLALRRTQSNGAVRSRAAVDSLLRLLEDDLGAALFGTEAVAHLRARLN